MFLHLYHFLFIQNSCSCAVHFRLDCKLYHIMTERMEYHRDDCTSFIFISVVIPGNEGVGEGLKEVELETISGELFRSSFIFEFLGGEKKPRQTSSHDCRNLCRAAKL